MTNTQNDDSFRLRTVKMTSSSKSIYSVSASASSLYGCTNCCWQAECWECGMRVNEKVRKKMSKKTREIESSSGNCVKWWWVAPDRIAKDQLLIAIKVNQVCASVSACLSVTVCVSVSCQYREREKTIAFKVNNWNWKWIRWSIHEMRNCKRVRVCRYFSIE